MPRRVPSLPARLAAAFAVLLAAMACRHSGRAPSSPPAPTAPSSLVHLKILGINDFHGQLSAGKTIGGRAVGGASVLGAYLRDAASGYRGRALIVHAGDQVGASPPASALMEDEPSIQLLNLLANAQCRGPLTDNPLCNVVGTLGNHELDEGTAELLRLLHGGNSAKGPFLQNPYAGARFPYVSANVVETKSGAPLLPPFVVVRLGGEQVGVIGAVLREAPTMVTPSGVAGLSFRDEVDSINESVVALGKLGVRAIIVTIHQGGLEPPFTGQTRAAAVVSGPIADIVARLDDEVDVVVSGHTHSFVNAFVKNAHGKPILVTQALSAGTAFDDIDVLVDRVTHDIVEKSAKIVTTFADAAPRGVAHADIDALVSEAEARVAPLVSRVVASAAMAITAAPSAAGESALGDLIADAQRAALHTDFAFMNPGGIRADIAVGPVTWGELFTVQPFGNDLVELSLTGAQVTALLEQQWQGQSLTRFLQVSGLTYTWDAARPVGHRIVEVRRGSAPIDPSATYTATVNGFVAAGGDRFDVALQARRLHSGPSDLDALVAYVARLPQPLSASIDRRVRRLN